MRYSELNQKHPCYDAERWADYDALYRGGKALDSRLSRFLPRNAMEPEERYRDRLRQVDYRSYLGPIVDFFSSFLFTASITIRAVRGDEEVDADPFYADFKEDVDASDTDLSDFMRRRFTEAMVKRCAYWLVEFPDDGGGNVESKADWQERALGEGFIRELPAESVLDWERDETGQLLWCIVHKREQRRDDPRSQRGIVRETWWLYDRTDVEKFQIEYDPKRGTPGAEQEIASVDKRAHKCSRVPLVEMAIEPEGLWVANRLASPQLEHLRLSCALSWSLKQSCYAQPVFKLESKERPPVMGSGYGIFIGTEESVEWIAPPAEHFTALATEIAARKDEIFRIAHQMASGVDNNSAAVGRSGDSKLADAASTQVILNAYGSIVREAIEETYELLSDGRGDDLDWSIEGLDKYDASDLKSLLEAISAIQALNIPSETLNRELFTKAGLAVLPDVSQETKDEIRKEIADGIVAEIEMREVMKQAEHDAKIEALEGGAMMPEAAKGAPKFGASKPDSKKPS